MNKIQLKKEYRDLIDTDRVLRCRIALDIMTHDITVHRWVKANNPKLTDQAFIDALKKHAKISTDSDQMVDHVTVTHPHEKVE